MVPVLVLPHTLTHNPLTTLVLSSPATRWSSSNTRPLPTMPQTSLDLRRRCGLS